MDIVLNNATVVRPGAVPEVPIEARDEVYTVNLRGPVLLAQAFLPGMVRRNIGVFVFVSSGAAPYAPTFEVFKTAQVELAKTIDTGMEMKNFIAFTIGPGLVKTPGTEEGVAGIASLRGKAVKGSYEMSRGLSF